MNSLSLHNSDLSKESITMPTLTLPLQQCTLAWTIWFLMDDEHRLPRSDSKRINFGRLQLNMLHTY